MKIPIFSLFPLVFGFGMAFADPITTDKIHFVDEQIMIMTDMSNSQNIQQNFAYITHKK